MRSAAIETTRNEFIKPIPMDKNITILNLGRGKYMFNSPFPVNIAYEDGAFIATSYDLNTFGYGPSEDEAIRDLCESIVEHFKHLKLNQDKLGPLLKRDWDFLSKIIVEIELV